MKWKEFVDNDLSCEECPLYQEDMCNGGMKCYGGEPIEPPCCSFNDDTDLDEYAGRVEATNYFAERLEDIQAQALEQQRERKRKRKETIAQRNSYC